jgi:hypothetical protein
MFEKCFSDIFKNCIGYTIYAHNLSSFDGILIIKVLYKLFGVKPLFKENKIMCFKIFKDVIINGENKKQSFYFKCSLVLLPLSLVKLIKSLSINIPKLAYPYKFINKDNLNYEGDIPSYCFYKDILKYDEYLELSNKFINKL